MLDPRYSEIIKNIQRKLSGHDSELLALLLEGKITSDQIQNVCTLINNEFLMEGIDENFEANTYGVELEKLLDLVNSNPTAK